MDNLPSSSTPSPVTFQALNGSEDQERKNPSPIMDSSLTRGDQSTILPESPSGEDSMTVNSGSMADNEETLLQTPGPLKDYSRSKITDKFQRRAQTPGIAYRTRSKDKILTKLQLFIDDLINIIDDDIELDSSLIKTSKDRNDEEPYSLVDEDSGYSYVLNPSKNTKT